MLIPNSSSTYRTKVSSKLLLSPQIRQTLIPFASSLRSRHRPHQTLGPDLASSRLAGSCALTITDTEHLETTLRVQVSNPQKNLPHIPTRRSTRRRVFKRSPSRSFGRAPELLVRASHQNSIQNLASLCAVSSALAFRCAESCAFRTTNN
jgi:hypothetical protein